MLTHPQNKKHKFILTTILFLGFIIGLIVSITKDKNTQLPNQDSIQIALQEQLHTNVHIEIEKQTETHARGAVRFVDEPGGGIFLAVKTDTGWEVPYHGNGAIVCEDMQAYGFPENMISDCTPLASAVEIVEITDISCENDNQCETPMDYLVKSNCPYGSRCIEGKCAVVCPEGWHHFATPNEKDMIETIPPEKLLSSYADPTELENKNLPKGTFAFNESGNFYGELFVRGYITTKEIPTAFCEENCDTEQGVFLNILETGNNEFQLFLEKNRDNSYVENTPPRVMIGCHKGDNIIYFNHSDELGMKEFLISSDDTRSFLQTSSDQPSYFRLEKYTLSGGMGAPTCYSHFTEIERLLD